MKTFATAKQVAAAPIATPFLECCGACTTETGNIILTSQGYVDGYRYPPRQQPSHFINPEARCEFCEFLGIWLASENIDPKIHGKHGAAKIVERDKDGVETTCGWITFSEHDARVTKVAEVPVEVKHGMVFLAQPVVANDLGGPGYKGEMEIVKVLKEGV